MKDTPNSVLIHDRQGKDIAEYYLKPEGKTCEFCDSLAKSLKHDFSMTIMGESSIMGKRLCDSTVIKWG